MRGTGGDQAEYERKARPAAASFLLIAFVMIMRLISLGERFVARRWGTPRKNIGVLNIKKAATEAARRV